MHKEFFIFTDGMQPFNTGGMQTHTYQLVNSVLDHVDVVHLFMPIDKHKDLGVDDIKAVFDSEKRDKLKVYLCKRPSLRFLPLLGYAIEEYLVSLRLYKAVINNKLAPKQLYAQGFTGWVSGKNGISVASHLHGFEFYQVQLRFVNKLKGYWLKLIAERVIKHSSLLISLGGGITDLLLNKGVDRIKILEHYNGFEPLDWPDSKTPNTFLFVGRNEPRKGFSTILNAWNTYGIEANLTVVGDITEIPNRFISFKGKITDKAALAREYKNAEFVILSSYSEGMPMVLLEAVRYGCIPITTKVGAISAYFNKDNSIEISAGDTKSIYDAVQTALNFTATDKQLIKENLKVVANKHTEKEITAKLLAQWPW